MLNWNEVGHNIDHPDGAEMIYDLALQYSQQLPEEYTFMEIGCWKGGTTMALMQAVKDSGKDRWVFSVDPYGSKPFKLGDGIQEEADYNELIYRDAMDNFATYAKQLGVKHYHWRLESDDFMDVADKVKFWDKGQTIPMKFGFVYIDGDHDGEVVGREMNWLKPRMLTGKSMIVLDDVPYITVKNQPIIQQALDEGFQDNHRGYWVVR